MKELTNKKLAFLFQGFRSEYKNLLELLDEKQLEELNNHSLIVDNEIGVNLSDYLFDSNNIKYDKYDRVFYDWIAGYTSDCIVYHTYIDFGIRPHIMLGYSMGLITALVCGNSISFETGLQMLLTIYGYSKRYAGQNEGMGVIIGKNRREVCKIIAGNSLKDDVYIASENSDTCIVISGINNSIGKVLKIAEDSGAIKAALINSPNAFHSPFAARGIESLVKFAEDMQVCDCEIPVMSVFNQNIIQSAPDLRKELVINVSGSMKWKDSILKLGDLGVDSFVEVSPDDSLTKMSRIINIDYDFVTYKKFLRLKNN